ncbi:extracellular solute-binding protein [Pusillimonas sp. TS35]|uniref:extracellular solute-binding protein n=1 Tax=Paracandidimonas lactea TaxID=2895524 RepID=UPI00136B6205|nr:extracellular solute-binding protein [Paracandidimonas lactea]MYN11912.1 extracellular solute-binding protein [Pusillimonas sp. TS35]
MKLLRLCGAAGAGRAIAWLGVGALACSSSAAFAATDIQVWHTLNGHNRDVFEKLVKDFNRGQNDVNVKVKAFDNGAAIEQALSGIKKADDRPQLVQLEDQHAADSTAGRKDIKPLYSLLAAHPIKNADWFLSDKNTFVRDAKGRLVAFPYMAEVPVMYYNIGAYNKAGIKPAEPRRPWAELQAQLVTLANNGSRKCPATSDQPVSINLENLAAVNNQLYVSNGNGLKGKGNPAFSFDSMYIRHLSMMITWVRSELMVKPEYDSVATKRFANNECAVLLSTSGNLGWFDGAKGLDFAVSGLPYYPEVTRTPGLPFVSGSALWATSGHAKASDAASAAFLSWLAQPERASAWFQKTGYLPLTAQAYKATDSNYFKSLGGWQELVAAYGRAPTDNSRGFRIDNYPSIHAMFKQTLEQALDGKQPAVTALKTASAQASKMMATK